MVEEPRGCARGRKRQPFNYLLLCASIHVRLVHTKPDRNRSRHRRQQCRIQDFVDGAPTYQCSQFFPKCMKMKSIECGVGGSRFTSLAPSLVQPMTRISYTHDILRRRRQPYILPISVFRMYDTKTLIEKQKKIKNVLAFLRIFDAAKEGKVMFQSCLSACLYGEIPM